MSEWIEGKGYRKKVLYKPADLGSEGNLVQIVEIEGGNKVPPHYHHSQTEIYNVQNGRAIIGIDDIDYKAHQGDTLICKPGDVHYVINDSSSVFRLLVFKVNYRENDTTWGTKK